MINSTCYNFGLGLNPILLKYPLKVMFNEILLMAQNKLMYHIV